MEKEPMTCWSPGRLRGVLPGSAAARMFILLSFIDAIGTGTFMAGAVVFFVRVIGLTNNQIGASLTIAGIVGLVMSVPMGVLGDHVGAKRLIVAMQFWRAVCFTALAFCDNVVVFFLIASGLSIAESITNALILAFVGSVVGEGERLRTMAVVRTVRNVGFSFGALLAVPLTTAGAGWLLYAIVLGNALSFVIAGVLLARIRTPPHQRMPSAPRPLAAIRGFRDWRYVGLAALNTLFSLHLSLLVIVIPLWILTATEAPAVIISALLLVNTAMAVVLQIPMSRPAETVVGSRRLLGRAGFALAVCSLAMVAASLTSATVAVVLLVLGMAFMTLAEIWQSAGAWTLSYTFAPETQRVQYLAIFGLSGLLAQDVLGPFLLGGLMIDAGRPGWIALAVVFVLGVPLLRPVVSSLTRQQEAAGIEPVAVH
jgi:MFS family permease